ncbi:hypothetical protein K7432_012544 [Basidiobolus ranarum]|uniref:Carrier domain-containing protein n=1 Tax=Basidiobolus ranarum TaxID=34480 RepID=A0ABR2VS41_9FUNG
MSQSAHNNNDFKNLLEVLINAARNHPNQGLRYINTTSDIANPTFCSYSKLLTKTCAIGEELRSLTNTHTHQIVVLYFDNHQDTVELFWGSLMAGFIPCILGTLKGDDEKKEMELTHLNTLFNSPIFLCRQKDHGELLSLVPYLNVQLIDDLNIPKDVEANTNSSEPEPSLSLDFNNKDTQDDVAVLLLTSGSTGNSKAVELTHANVLAAIKFKVDDYHLKSTHTLMNWVGCDHVAGLIENHITPIAAGANQIQVAASVITLEPLTLLEISEAFGVAFTFAPNFLLANIEKNLRNKLQAASSQLPLYNLSKLKRINSGGEANLVDLGKQLLLTLEEAKTEFKGIITPGFGMTETCAGCIYNKQHPYNDTGKEFASLGSPSDGLCLRVVDDDDQILATGSCGNLEITCPQLFKGYYNNPDANEQAFTKDGWFRTGDTANLANGKLELVGRTKDSIILRGVNYYSNELESSLQNIEGIVPSFVAVCPIRPKGSQTEKIAVFYLPTFSLSDEEALIRTHSSIQQQLILFCSQAAHIISPLSSSILTKNSLGKLSRGKLRQRYEKGEFNDYLKIVEQIVQARKVLTYKKPISDSEITLASFLCQIFEVAKDEMCAEENFFSMGGSSLEVVQYKAKIIEHFKLDKNWPIIRIMQHPTIRELASHLDASQSNTEGGLPNQNYDPVVPLQVTGSGVPIFFVHPGVGEVLIFVNLAKYFANERPFYALRARGFDENQTYFESMEEMADNYTAAIRKTQPQGPYAVAGYSYGGVVAYEIAKRLEAQNQRVALVGLVNIPPHIKPRMLELNWTEGFLNLSYFLDLITKEEAARVSPHLHTLTRPEQIHYVWSMASPERIKELQIDPIQLEKWVDIAESLLLCGRNYEPSGHVEQVSVFYATPLHGKKEDWLNLMLKKWDGFSKKPNNYIDVPGAHYTLMNHQYVPFFQKHLKAELIRAGI